MWPSLPLYRWMPLLRLRVRQIVGATCGRLTERDQMEAAKGRPYGVGEWLARGRG